MGFSQDAITKSQNLSQDSQARFFSLHLLCTFVFLQLFRGSLKSLNSGIVTVLNYGKDVPSTVSHVTMAHEMGHNMGSQVSSLPQLNAFYSHSGSKYCIVGLRGQ